MTRHHHDSYWQADQCNACQSDPPMTWKDWLAVAGLAILVLATWAALYAVIALVVS